VSTTAHRELQQREYNFWIGASRFKCLMAAKQTRSGGISAHRLLFLSRESVPENQKNPQIENNQR
jgi:hypothetical protein